MKLSKAQQTIINKAHEEIDFARTHTLEEWAKKRRDLPPIDDPTTKWFIKEHGQDAYDRYVKEQINGYIKRCGKYYELAREGIVLCTANTRTLNKLESLGLIEIVNIGGSTPDRIKILNY